MNEEKNKPESGQDGDEVIKPDSPAEQSDQSVIPKEQGGFENTAEPTRYGDWEIAGKCVDF